jgi:hypothetical protein
MKQGSNGNYSPIGSLLKLIVMMMMMSTNQKFELNRKFHVDRRLLSSDIGRYNIIDIISYHYITFSRILIFFVSFFNG